jgi:general secretion pathway protein G
LSFLRYHFARGFTLVELLVVIVIVGLLASLSVPVIGRAMGTAKTAQCASNMRQVVQGLLQWSANNDTRVHELFNP